MERMICLDGVPVRLDVDRVEVNLNPSGLAPADHPEGGDSQACCRGEVWHAIMSYQDGTTIYLHCPAEGEEGTLGYKIEGPRPHRWNISFLDSEPSNETVAMLSWESL